jgi:hypothetical protein
MGRCRAFCNGKMVFVVFGKKEWVSNQLIRRCRLKYVSCDGETLVLEIFSILQNVYFWCCMLSISKCLFQNIPQNTSYFVCANGSGKYLHKRN